MYKQKGINHYTVPNKWNKCAQITVILFGFALINMPAFAKKAVPKPESATENSQMISHGKEGTCVGEIASPSKLTLPLGKSTLIKLPEPIVSRLVDNPAILDTRLIAKYALPYGLFVGNPAMLQARLISPLTLYVVGLDIGSTNMIIQGKSGACSVIDVTVSMDPDGLQQTLNALMPDEKNIQVTAAAESLILSGTVEDAISAGRAVDIAHAYVSRKIKPVQVGKDGADGNSQNNQQNNASGQNADAVSPRIVNLLNVRAPQQVMLEVKVAEVSKSLLDKLGASLLYAPSGGNVNYSFLTSLLSNSASIFSGGSKTKISLDAENKDGLVKILAEPTIMAISGQEGSFLAGGTIFIPVSQTNNNGTPTITLEEKEFGVGVKFTPTVLAGGRINLRVAPEVSELNRDGVGITASGISGTAILPSFTTRRASTTVQLMDGQSFAIGGLIKNNTTTNIKAFPILGEIPILGALFRSTDFQKDKTELVFIITPHLVKPLTANNVRLPTDRYVDPTRSDLFLNGKMEGNLPANTPPRVAPPALPNEMKQKAIKPNEPAANTGFDVR